MLPSVIFEDSHLHRRRFPGSEEPLECFARLLVVAALAITSWIAAGSSCDGVAPQPRRVERVKRQKVEASIRKIITYTPNSGDKRVSVSADLAIIPITAGARGSYGS